MFDIYKEVNIVRDCKGCPVSLSDCDVTFVKVTVHQIGKNFYQCHKKNTHQLYGSRLKKWSFYGQADRNISWPFRLCYTAIRTEKNEELGIVG